MSRAIKLLEYSDNAVEVAEQPIRAKEGKKRKKIYTQYRVSDNVFYPMGSIKTQERLDPGIYNLKSSMSGIYFEVHNLNTDEIIRFDDARHKEVLEEIQKFWTLKDNFSNMGFSHKRGILLYGDPGTGKSALTRLVMEDMVNSGDVIFICDEAYTLKSGLQKFREVEKERQVVCIIEDIDGLLRYGEKSILELFDGDYQCDNVLFLATTNYVDKIPPRVLRTGRFDRKLEISNPPKEGRLAYLRHKLATYEDSSRLGEIADKTDGFSFAQLREYLVAVYCLQQDETKVIDRIKKGLEEGKYISESLFNTLMVGINGGNRATKFMSLNEVK